MDAQTIITAGHGEASLVAQIADLTAQITLAVQALQDACALLTSKAAQIAGHERVLATGDSAGHFKMGMGFEYDPKNGCHNINGTADFVDAMSQMTWNGPAPVAKGE